ncbi:MAG: HD domain-containing protein [Gemmatimonadota bacterium]
MSEAQALQTPREWLGEAPFPWPSFESVEDGALLRACFFVTELRADTTRAGQPYLRLRLADRNGLLEGMVWDDVERIAPTVRQGAYVGVSGRVGSYNGRKQLRVEALAPLRVSPEEAELFVPRSSRDPREMAAELDDLVESISDDGLRAVVRRCLDPATDVGRLFLRSPAAKRNHHAYAGGLLEHTLSVTQACDGLARHYGEDVDRDLLVAGALLHDIGKTREISLAPGFPYSDEGRLLGHIVIGLAHVEAAARLEPGLDEGRRTLLLHLIAAHQGRYEWQSPREPMILEALLLHYADDLDAKMAQVRGRLAHAPAAGWSGYDRSLGREFYRHLARERAGTGVVDAAAEGRYDTADAGPGAEDVEPAESGPGAPSLFDALPD